MSIIHSAYIVVLHNYMLLFNHSEPLKGLRPCMGYIRYYIRYYTHTYVFRHIDPGIRNYIHFAVRTCSYRHTFLHLYIFTTPQVASDATQLNIRFSCNQLSLIIFPHTIYSHKLRRTFEKLVSVSLR